LPGYCYFDACLSKKGFTNSKRKVKGEILEKAVRSGKVFCQKAAVLALPQEKMSDFVMSDFFHRGISEAPSPAAFLR